MRSIGDLLNDCINILITLSLKNTMLQGDGSSIYTPPASIYYEDSDEESDRELRRSKRRPKRYESDEDFVLDSGDETPHQPPSFLYDECDEGELVGAGSGYSPVVL